MPAEHLLPIDLDTTHATARGVRRFRWFVAGLALMWIGALAAAVRLTPLPSIWPLLIFGALVVAAEHRFILFGDETSMSASIVVILCAVTYWHGSAYLVGPMVVASFAGLLLPHLRERSCRKVFANSFGASIASGVASLFLSLISTQSTSMPLIDMCGIVLAAGCYWTINNLVVARYVSDHSGVAFRKAARSLVFSDTLLVWFAIGSSSLVFMIHGRLLESLIATAALAWIGVNELGQSIVRREYNASRTRRILRAIDGGVPYAAVLATIFQPAIAVCIVGTFFTFREFDRHLDGGFTRIDPTTFLVAILAISSFNTALSIVGVAVFGSLAIIKRANSRLAGNFVLSLTACFLGALSISDQPNSGHVWWVPRACLILVILWLLPQLLTAVITATKNPGASFAVITGCLIPGVYDLAVLAAIGALSLVLHESLMIGLVLVAGTASVMGSRNCLLDSRAARNVPAS